MAAAVGTPTVVHKIISVNKIEVIGTLAISASPATYATGGLLTNFNVAGIQASLAPQWVELYGIAGFIYAWVLGTDITNGKLMIFAEGTVATDAPLVELSTAAIPAAISGDTIRFRAVFRKLR